jgi:hypothetical protein
MCHRPLGEQTPRYGIRCKVAGGHSFGYSKTMVYRILSTGDGIFGEERSLKNINRLQLKIYSVKRVSRYLPISFC